MTDFRNEAILNALAEDIGTCDITTLSTVSEDARAKARFTAKESGVLCGIDAVRKVFSAVGDNIEFEPFFVDGDEIRAGDTIACVSGSARAVLTAERTALNFLQHLSGIATKTRSCVQSVEGTGAKICDTRKTTPGLRAWEKYAVRTGGGHNHRFNLSDGVLIKDNHIKAAGGIAAAVNRARALAPHTLKIEVEVEDFDMLREALSCGADIIMLDNMSLTDMREAVKIAAGGAIIEASGNMGGRNLREVAETGVDYISIGALTHSVKALDISLKFE